MKTWLAILAPLILWLVHFLAIYLAAEFMPAYSYLVVFVLTVTTLPALFFLFFRNIGQTTWLSKVISTGAAAGAVGVTWQALPMWF